MIPPDHPMAGPQMSFEGAALVLRGAFQATMPLQIGDALKVTGEWKVAPTQLSDDEVVGTAWNSANTGQDVAVAVAGMARIVSLTDVARGDPIVPSESLRGRGRKADKVADLLSGKARKYAVAAETKPAGKPVWVVLRGI